MNRHTLRARPPVTTAGGDGPVGAVAGVLATVGRLGEDLDAWGSLLHEEQTPHEPGEKVRVLIDQAEDLRRRLRQAGDTCRAALLAQAPPRPGVRCPPAPVRQPVPYAGRVPSAIRRRRVLMLMPVRSAAAASVSYRRGDLI